jgi:hypothetical protein
LIATLGACRWALPWPGAKVDERQLLLSILEAGPTPDCRAATPDHDRGKNY